MTTARPIVANRWRRCAALAGAIVGALTVAGSAGAARFGEADEEHHPAALGCFVSAPGTVRLPAADGLTVSVKFLRYELAPYAILTAFKPVASGEDGTVASARLRCARVSDADMMCGEPNGDERQIRLHFITMDRMEVVNDGSGLVLNEGALAVPKNVLPGVVLDRENAVDLTPCPPEPPLED